MNAELFFISKKNPKTNIKRLNQKEKKYSIHTKWTKKEYFSDQNLRLILWLQEEPVNSDFQIYKKYLITRIFSKFKINKNILKELLESAKIKKPNESMDETKDNIIHNSIKKAKIHNVEKYLINNIEVDRFPLEKKKFGENHEEESISEKTECTIKDFCEYIEKLILEIKKIKKRNREKSKKIKLGDKISESKGEKINDEEDEDEWEEDENEGNPEDNEGSEKEDEGSEENDELDEEDEDFEGNEEYFEENEEEGKIWGKKW